MAKAAKRKPQAVFDPDQTRVRFQAKLRQMPLKLLVRQLRAIRAHACVLNQRLSVFQNENCGRVPLTSAPLAPHAYVLNLKYGDVARELFRRGVQVKVSPSLGGPTMEALINEIVTTSREKGNIFADAPPTNWVDRVSKLVGRWFRRGKSDTKERINEL